jgi:hypothetical protein
MLTRVDEPLQIVAVPLIADVGRAFVVNVDVL